MREMDFTENLGDKDSMKFPHCVISNKSYLTPKLAGVVVNDGKKHKAHLLLLRLQHIS